MSVLQFKRQRQLRADYATTFGTDHGRRVLADMAKASHMLSTTYVPEKPNDIFIREGERNAFLRIAAILRWNKLELDRLIEETTSNVQENS